MFLFHSSENYTFKSQPLDAEITLSLNFLYYGYHVEKAIYSLYVGIYVNNIYLVHLLTALNWFKDS